MHRSRQWIILTLLGLVGLGPIGSGELLAQTVQSVNIKKGGTVGIGKGFLVDVTVQDFDQSPATDVVVFLVAKSKPHPTTGEIDTLLIESGYELDVVGNGLEPAPEDADGFGEGNDESAAAYIASHPRFSEGSIAPCSGPDAAISDTTASGLESDYCSGGTIDALDNPFAAYRRRGDVTNPDTRNMPGGTTDAPEPIWFGDVDSLHVTGTDVNDGKIATREHRNKPVGETYLFRWYAQGSYILGEHDEVYAAAFVTDGDATEASRHYSDVVLSGNSMAIDGDRPVQGSIYTSHDPTRRAMPASMDS